MVSIQSDEKTIDADWVHRYFATVDTLNADAIVVHFVEDSRFRFGNSEPVVGKTAIREALAEFFSTIQAMHHHKVGLWLDNQSAVFEAEVTYTRMNDTVIVLPCTSILRLDNDQIYDFRMYMDIAPVLHQPNN